MKFLSEYGDEMSQLSLDLPLTELEQLHAILKDYEKRLRKNQGDSYLIGAIKATEEQIDRYKRDDFPLPSDVLPERRRHS